MKRQIGTFIFLIGVGFSGWTQPVNDDCFGAIFVSNPINYCSGISEFNNTGASNELTAVPGCFGAIGSDVWFSFVSVASSISITVNGNSLPNPAVALYTTIDCQSFIAVDGGLSCGADNAGLGSVQLIWNGLIVGQTFYIRAQGLANGQGSFQLCLNNFFQPAQPGSDFISGSVLCDRSGFTVEQINGVGIDPNEAAGTCLDPGGYGSESQSVWYRWIAESSGSLEFVLEPININDDLDFALYEFPNGINDPNGKILLSCNATFGGNGASCGPNTGLAAGQTENVEDAGCEPDEDGFNAPVQLTAGVVYGLIVNNFSQSGLGFNVSFGGTAEIQGPQPDFIATANGAFECDKSVVIEDLSTGTALDNIVSWNWIFGQGATPSTGISAGPHTISFESFGPKTIVLTVESDRGCIVSSTQTLEIESCCADVDAISTSVSVTDVLCFGDSTGIIELSAIGGNPPYLYSVNGDRLLPFSRFENLAAGAYTIVTQDIKGCENTVVAQVIQPNDFIAFAGDDISISLGGQGQLSASTSSLDRTATISWNPATDLSCTDCYSPITSAFISTTYTFTAVDSAGCTASDSVFVEVEFVRRDFAPDLFTPNDDGHNDRYNIYGGRPAERVARLEVYNRWGDLLYKARDLPFGNQDGTIGWDGTFQGINQPTGVYAFRAFIVYLNGEQFTETGNFTLLR